MGLPRCRASQMFAVWPPALTDFCAYGSVIISGPPALPVFPCTRSEASGLDRLPCMCRSTRWASHHVGLPRCPHHGLRKRPASVGVTVYSSPGLPLCRAFLARAMRPLASTSIYVCVDPRGGPPAMSGFPDVYSTTFGIGRLPGFFTIDISSSLSPRRASCIDAVGPPA